MKALILLALLPLGGCATSFICAHSADPQGCEARRAEVMGAYADSRPKRIDVTCTHGPATTHCVSP